jgi:hypothetical protein
MLKAGDSNNFKITTKFFSCKILKRVKKWKTRTNLSAESYLCSVVSPELCYNTGISVFRIRIGSAFDELLNPDPDAGGVKRAEIEGGNGVKRQIVYNIKLTYKSIVVWETMNFVKIV